MKRATLAIVLTSGLLGACQFTERPCGRNEERVIHTMCSCPEENKQDPEHSCCRRDGGVCADEELIPPPRTSWPPSAGALLGIWDFGVHPAELTFENELVPSQNSFLPTWCQPMFAEWDYVNLANGPLGDSSEVNVRPVFKFAGPFQGDGIEMEERRVQEVLFDRMPQGGRQHAKVIIKGQSDPGTYQAYIDQLPVGTPGDYVQNIEVDDEWSDEWEEIAIEFCD